MEKDNPRLGTLALFACMAGVSAAAVLNKLAMAAGLHPIWLNVLRLGITLLVMLPFFLRKRGAVQAIRTLPAKERRLTLLSGAMLAVHFTTWAFSLFYAESVVAVSIWSTFSLMTVVGSSLILHERTPLPALLGIVLAIVGVAVCAIGASGSQLTGIVMALLAALSQAVYTLCGRAVRKKLETLPYTMVVYGVAFVCLLVCALVLRLPPEGMNVKGIGTAVALAFICTLGGHSMQNYALRYYKAPTVSAAILTEVFTGPLLVFLFMGEAPSLVNLIGGAIIMVGVAWYMYYEWRHAHGALQGHGGQAERPRVQA